MKSSEFFKRCNSVMNDMVRISAFGGKGNVIKEEYPVAVQEETVNNEEFLFIDDSFIVADDSKEVGVQDDMEDFGIADGFLDGSETEMFFIEETEDVQKPEEAIGEAEKAAEVEEAGSYSIYPSFGLVDYQCGKPCGNVNRRSLTDILLLKLCDDLYVVKDDRPLKEIYNLNFLTTVEDDTEALQRLILIYYEISIEKESLEADGELLTDELLSGLSGFGRTLTLSDLRIFSRLLTDNKNFDFFKTYAYTEEIALLMQQTLDKALLDTEEFLLYSANADFLNVYLRSVLDGSYSREALSPMLISSDSGIDFSILDRRILQYVPLVQGRGDREDVFTMLTALADRGVELEYTELSPYRDSPYLKEIIDSWGRAWFSLPFIDKYLRGECDACIVNYYAGGKLNPSVFQRMGCDVFLTMVVSDMLACELSEKTLLGLCFGDGGKSALGGVQVLAEAYYSGVVTQSSYRQALYVLEMKDCCQLLLQFLYEEGVMPSFNSVLYGMAAKALGCRLVLEGINAKTIEGAVLFVMEDSSVKACTAENLLFGFSRLADMQGMFDVRLLNNNAGFCIICRSVKFDDRLLKYSVLSSGSLDTWGSLQDVSSINTFGHDIKLYCNTVLFLNEHPEVADTLLAKNILFQGGNTSRILKERLFYRLRSDLSWAWSFLLCAHATEWFPLLIESCTCIRSGLVMYKVLSKVLADWCDSRLVLEKPVIQELPKGEGIIELRGFPYSFDKISYHSFFMSFDGILPKFNAAKKIILSQRKNIIEITVA